jgi:hypothetical protein
MKQALLLASATLLAFTAAPALAKPGNGHGKGHGHGQKHGQQYVGYGHQQLGYGQQYGYGQRGCPPGLAKKNNGCLPPGQAKKLGRGDRYVSGYGTPYGYNQLPYDVREQYGLDPYNNYYYDQGTLYGVDRRSGIIEQVLGMILR